MPLHKSFSDQSGRAKAQARQQWHRSGSVPNPQNQPERPRIPVSATTKTKLQAFHFQAPNAESAERLDHGPRPAKSALSAAADGAPTTGPEGAGKENKPLAGPNADAVDPQVHGPAGDDGRDTASASDRISWMNPGLQQRRFPDYSPMPSSRRRKRARSSSPCSSSPVPTKQPATPAVNVKSLASALKTPHADPALELWDRFSLVAAHETSPSNLTNPLLAHLIASSSPRPAKGDAEILPATSQRGSLRKAISCGSHWPKRRKIDRMAGVEVEGLALAASRESPMPNMKSSMVSALLQTVDGEIRKSKLAQVQENVSTSPSPRQSPRQSPRHKRLARGQAPHMSPSRRAPAAALAGPPKDDLHTACAEVGNPHAGGLSPSTSDFGSCDFDDETLLELDASISLLQGEDATVVASPGLMLDRSDKAVSVVTTPAEAPQPARTMVPATEDDFGDFDDDDDIFEGAEALVAELESKHPSQKSLPPPKKRAGSPQNQNAYKDEGDAYDVVDMDDFDFDAAELVATQSFKNSNGSAPSNFSQKPKAIQRYLVTNILESSYDDDRGRECPEKILIVQADGTNSTRTVHLRGDWCDTQASAKSFIHIIGEFEPSGRCIIDNDRNMLILHPDHLISSTVLADSFSCMRRAVLQDRVKATSDMTPPLVYGTIIHEIFQEAMMVNKWDTVFLASLIDKILEKHLEDLYIIRVGVPDAREHLLSKMAEMRSWARMFLSVYPRPDAVVQGRSGEKITMSVTKLLDVEEHVWSPMYGLKGNIDATVEVVMREGKEASSRTKTLTVPFEVKTGRNVTSNHQAQTALYNLLLSDRYDIEVLYGILYYSETSQTMRIPAIRHEMRHMVMQRNLLACYIRERSVNLPPMKRSQNMCGRCYAQTACFTYHRLADDGTGESSGMGAKFDELVKHLTPTDRDFFLKWEDLLTKEEKVTQKHRRELWTMVSAEREKLGRCFGNIVIQDGSAAEDEDKPKINRFTYTFVKEKPAPGFSFLDSQLAVGEPIVVSDEQGHFALGLGFVKSVRKRAITVAVDRRLHNARVRQPGFDEIGNQVFAGIMEVGRGQQAVDNKPQQQQAADKPRTRFRLDKDEFSNGMATVRNNLVQAMSDGVFGASEIRRLVVDLQPPRFKDAEQTTQYSIPADQDLNVDQRDAVHKVMSAQDYALVLGMPGTGKTFTTAHIIRALVGQGKSVLLTSYTHSAVDNILLKLRHDAIPILRLGAPAKVHAEVRAFPTLAAQPGQLEAATSADEIRRMWHGTPVVATTCLGIGHPLFTERTFDYCIVDEASQITLPICLGPIRMARTFVLVGDHNQLPPLVQDDGARKGGLDVSLFKLLCDSHPRAVASLRHQYRMCEDIMALSNTLIYRGELRCGTEELRHARLHVPDLAALRRRHFDAANLLTSARSQQQQQPRSFCAAPNQGGCWLRDLLDPAAPVRFVNTDGLADGGGREQARGARIVNPGEARVVAQLVDALLACGVPAAEIGVLTHYRSQLAVLRHALRYTAASSGGRPGSRSSSSSSSRQQQSNVTTVGDGGEIEMHTADRFQGRDKSVVVLSLVRSNAAGSIGELLRDWRRINVAFTRARTKLLVVGSRNTMRGAVAGKNKQDRNGGGDGGGDGKNSCDSKDTDGDSKDGEGNDDMLARFVELMEQRDWIYDLPAAALHDHHFASLDAAAAAADAPTQASTGGNRNPASPPRKSPQRKSPPLSQLSTQQKQQQPSPSALSPKGGHKRAVKRGRLVIAGGDDKENQDQDQDQDQNQAQPRAAGGRGPKRARMGERALMKAKGPIVRDILNELMDGGF